MAWEMIQSGAAAESIQAKFSQCEASWVGTMGALDDRGRLYAWGEADYGTGHMAGVVSTGHSGVVVDITYPVHPAVDTNASPVAMLVPYQVGTKENWVRIEIGEYGYVGLDDEGYLWAWGTHNYGVGGWKAGFKFQWSYFNLSYIPGGDICVVPEKIDASWWADFALGWYHCIGLRDIGVVWIWGLNDYDSFGNPSLASGQIFTYPILVTGLPETQVTLVSAGYNVSAIVTIDNEVWAWGEFDPSIGTLTTPTQIPFTIPTGESIAYIECDYIGIVIILSNGDCYAIGRYIACVLPYPYRATVFTKIPGDISFTKVKINDHSIVALDTTGKLWSWFSLIGGFQLSQGESVVDCAYGGVFDAPILMAASEEHVWVDFSMGSYTHLAIDTNGQLFSWGTNYNNTLGNGLTYSQHTQSCQPQLTAAALDVYGEPAGLNTRVYGERLYAEPESQELAHKPCGYWYTTDPNAEHEYPANSWQTVLGINGDDLLLIASGAFFPNHLEFLSYNKGTNIWTSIYSATSYLTHQWLGGAALDTNIYAYHAYKSDVSGARLDEVFTNYSMSTWVIFNGLTNFKEWPGTLEMSGTGKVLVDPSGLVVVIVQDLSTFRVEISLDGGITYSTKLTLAYTADRSDFRLGMDSNGYIYVLTSSHSTGNVEVRRSIDNGTTWTLQATKFTLTAPTGMELIIEGTKLFMTITGTGGASLYTSTNFGVTWIKDSFETDSRIIGATENLVYNMQEGVDYRTEDHTSSTIYWEPVTDSLVPTYNITSTLKNSGENLAYTALGLQENENLILKFSTSLGSVWENIPTPLKYYETWEDTQLGTINPIWDFTSQSNKT